MTTIRRVVSVVLVVCIIAGMSTSALAAGKGYSDLIKTYTLSGVDGKEHIVAIAYAYGSTGNAAKDNNVAVIKINTKNNSAFMDIMNGEAFNQLLQTCITFSQVDVKNYNELLLAYGVPDEFLSLDDKPYVVAELEKAIAEKKTTVTIRDSITAFPEALKMAKDSGITAINFDSIVNNAINVRITVNPANATKGIVTLANALSSNDQDPTYKMMNAFYSNRYAQIDFFQEGSFGTTVHVATKPENLGNLKSDSLMFYSYNSVTNKISLLENTNHYIDKNGFLHLETSMGGTIIITDAPLTKK